MPSFAIEVPGEANPLTENLLVHSLRSASSSDPNQIQTGTKQLQQWERSPGYYKHLQSAYLDRRLPVELRYLAVIQLKNGIDKYWRKTATNAVSKDDKNAIRSRLLDGCLNEPDDRLALQSALVIAKIARFEYPNDWPDALSSLVQILRQASQIPPKQLGRALLTLLHIVKELSTGRLQRTRQNLQAATPEIVHVLSGLYGDAIAFWTIKLKENLWDEMIVEPMKLSLLAIKILRRLLIAGYENPHRDNEVPGFWSASQQHLGSFIPLRPSIAGFDRQELLEKNLLQLAKLHHEMAKEHPAAFALLPNSVSLVQAYWDLAKDYGNRFGSQATIDKPRTFRQLILDGEEEEEQQFTEKLALRGLLILRACVKMVHSPSQTFRHRTPEDKQEKHQATELVRQHLLSAALVQEVMEVLVTRFFVFRESDLREWEEEPEEWEKREEGDGEDWEFSLRSCSEKLFLDLAINYKDMLVQPLLQVFYSVATPENEDVMFKDSVYTAIGLAAPVVHEQLDFDAFIRDVLVAEVQKQKSGFHILRRRAAILLGQWISVRITERQLVYQIFQYLLNHEDPLNDQVVRVTAGRQLSKIIDDWDNKPSDLEPHVDTMLTRLLHLIAEVELTETKMALLNTVSVLVEKMDHLILPFASRIVSALPVLWEDSGEEHLMKQAILTILSRLVNAMKAESAPLHSMVVPIIQGAMQRGSDTEVYLLEDAMDLWAAIIVQTRQPAPPEILQLLPYLFPIYEFGSEELRKALEITESYILLAPEYITSEEVRRPLFAALTNLLRTLKSKSEANGMVCNIIELILRSAHRLGGETAVEQTTADLVESGFLPTLLHGLRGSWQAHCTTGPLAKDPPVDGIVETDYFSVLARILLGSLPAFLNAITAGDPSLTDSTQALDLSSTMTWLLEEWFSHFENIGDPSRRKLMTLALTSILRTNQPFILLNLQSLMSIWTDVITELRDEAAENCKTDSLVYSAALATTPTEVPEAPEETRRREVTYSDEVHTINLVGYVTQELKTVIEACGGNERFQEEWLVNVDKEVVGGFMQLGIV